MLQCTGGWHGRWTKRGKWCEMLNRYFVAAWIVNKQLICLMLKICNYKHVHEIWEFDLRHGKFWIINCQHNIGASKRLIVDRLYCTQMRPRKMIFKLGDHFWIGYQAILNSMISPQSSICPTTWMSSLPL